MLNAAMVLMILAGVLGLPAAMCSGMCSSLTKEMGRAGADVSAGQSILDFLAYLAIGASIGSVIIGAMVKKLKRIVSGIASIIFMLCFVSLLIQANILGIGSSVLLLVSAILIFVAPAEQFKNI